MLNDSYHPPTTIFIATRMNSQPPLVAIARVRGPEPAVPRQRWTSTTGGSVLAVLDDSIENINKSNCYFCNNSLKRILILLVAMEAWANVWLFVVLASSSS
jgi:hypothetical protein